MKFIDLFAGLGGFHQALASLGHECVFASEIDPELANLYQKNFGTLPAGDIRLCHLDVPPHDILCAGFPCQPFSKAGGQRGFDCPQWGDLFEYVIEILTRHKPRFLLVENVPNLMRHDGGQTWERVCARLRAAGYAIDSKLLSPHLFGVPQIRDRAVIVGARRGLQHFNWPSGTHEAADLNIQSVLDQWPADARVLTEASVGYLEAWQALLDELPTDEKMPSFPIWAMEFGATYPYRVATPASIPAKYLGSFKGAFGTPLRDLSKRKMLAAVPVYARDHRPRFPEWKISFIMQNRAFYHRHKKIIDRWLPSIRSFAPSFQKLEWNWQEGPRDLWQTVIQFRASGIRAKKPTAAPSLVALTTSQVPVIPWQSRYMSMRECARLQSMGNLKYLPAAQTSAHRALGNAVNVQVIVAVAKALVGPKKPRAQAKAIEPTAPHRNTPKRGLRLEASLQR